MSTLRISNIEAKADNSSPTVDEQLKFTNSTGDVLLHLDGRTSGITTVGINTTAQTIKFDENNNVFITGIVTATELHGTVAVGTSITYGDNEKAYFGTGLDLQIFHNNSDSVISQSAAGTGNLKILSGGAQSIECIKAGAVNIAHNGNTKFTTKSTGAEINYKLSLGGAAGSPGILELYEGGAVSEIRVTRNSDANSDLQFKTERGDGTVTRAKINYSGDFVVPSNKVGIGTDDPGRALTIRNAEPRIRLIDDDTGSFSEVYTDNTGHLYLSADAGQSNGGSRILCNVDGVEKLRIANNGDVTVTSVDAGATGPTLKILHNSASPAANDVVSRIGMWGDDSAGNETEYGRVETIVEDPTNGQETAHLQFGTRGLSSWNPILRLKNRSTASAPSYTTDDINGIILDVYNTGNPYPRYMSFIAKSAGNTDSNISFWTEAVGGSPTEKLRITSLGKIGISTGTIDPDGNQLLIRAASTVGTTKGHIMLTGDGATVDEGPQIVFSESGSGSNFAGAYIGHARKGSNSIGDLVFGTRATSGDANTVPLERLRIDSTGRVLIGGGSSPTQVGDGQLIVYSSDRKHPSIKTAGTSSNNANGYTMLGDNYQADESQVNLGVSYSSSSLVLSRCCKVSDAADNTYLSSQDSYNARPTALVMDNDGALRFHTTETNATTTTDSAVSLTEVFKIDKVGNIYQRITGRFLFMGASNQLQIGVNGSDPYINAASGDLQVRDAGNVCYVVRSDNLQMYMDIKMNQGKGISFVNAADTATGETVSSSVLDEYEEGDWTPSNAHLTVNNVYSARYIKVGRIVHLSFAISFAASPADTAQTAWIDGLPFQSHNKAQYVTLDWVGTSSSAAYRNTNTEHVIFANTSRITFYYPTGAHAQTRSHVAGKQVRGTFTYLASA